jgi:hypothetical protein
MVLLAGTLITLVVFNRPTSFDVAEVAATSDRVTIRFNMEVDQKAVESLGSSLFSLTDAQGRSLEYELKVIDKQTVVLEPKAPLEPGQMVKVEAAASIPNKNGTVMPQKHVESKVVAPATTTARPTATSTTVVVAQVPTVTPAPTSVSVTTTLTTVVTSTTIAVTPTITPTVTVTTTVAATPTITPDVTLTPTPVVTTTTTPVITSTTAVTGTATVTPQTPTPGGSPGTTPTPATTAADCQIPAAVSFARILNGNQELLSRLGCPNSREVNISLLYQPYEKGFMLFYNNTVYVLAGNNTWRSFGGVNTTVTPVVSAVVTSATPEVTASPTVTSTVTSPTGKTPVLSPAVAPAQVATATPTPNNFGCNVVPGSSFIQVWRNNAEVRNLLGCPLSPTVSVATIAQTFRGGQMISNPQDVLGRRIYTLFTPDTYRVFVEQ